MIRSDIYKAYARVIEMCEGTNVKYTDCWRIGGVIQNKELFLGANTDSLESYSFALAIFKDRAIFSGDVLFNIDHGSVRILESRIHDIPNFLREFKNDLSWDRIDEFDDLKQAQKDGYRIEFQTYSGWVNMDSLNNFNNLQFERDRYKIVKDLSVRKNIQVFGELIDIEITKCGITGEISVKKYIPSTNLEEILKNNCSDDFEEPFNDEFDPDFE